MKTITILTPAYNRAELLKRLYQSLKEQTCQDFVWMIIDDGSKDETGQVIEAFQKENCISIVYERQENGGKHRALNRGIARIDSELTFIVDSDDFLPKDGVEIILKYHKKYKDTENLCGYSFLRCYEDGSVNTAYFKVDEEISTYREVRINGNIGGDKAEVFFTEILKKYPFPEFEGEKFMPEDTVWMQMSGPYEMVHINRCIYISEYLEGGLTKSGRAMKIYSPLGMMCRSMVYLKDTAVNLKVKLKMQLLYIIYGRFAGKGFGKLLKEVPNKLLFAVLYLPGSLLYLKWKSESRG